MTKYAFNTSRFAQLKEGKNLSIYRIKKDVHRTNQEVVQRWIDGSVLRGEDIVDVCNAYHFSPIEFFLCDGVPMTADAEAETATNSESEILKQQLQFSNERAELEKKHLQQVSDIEKNHAREVSELEKAHLRELMQKDIDLAKKEATIREDIRREMREEYESQIAALRNQFIDLTAQYRELELMTGTRRISAVAECKGSTYGAQNK